MTSMTAAPQMTANTSDADTTHKRKMIQAAHEFEALLLNTLLGPLEQTFSSLPGKKPDPESDNYHYLGMQALSSTLAAGKGLGIADMIIRSLLPPGHAASSGK
jgi:Rod binding domain-containing protein